MNTKAESLLKKYFGYDSFRPMQAQIIQSILNKKDTVVLMPTGGGKSICFQIPALILPGLCVVISPLISLMKDQVDTLNANGIAAEFLNSSLDVQTQNTIIQKCKNNEIKILYISPERVTKDIDYLLKSLSINMFAIDEAHCVSSWGHDFRPEYTKLGVLKTNFPNIPIIALTATANLQTRNDIIKQLNLDDAQVFTASFDRPNLSITIKHEVKAKERILEIINFAKNNPLEAGVIYCLSRKSCDDLAKTMQENGINAASYHAGLSTDQRNQVQEDFLKDKIQLVSATIAFGMGIDKSNVRYVTHYNTPKSIEGYYQEIGRAGRDGLASDTIMYFSYFDFNTLKAFAEKSNQSKINIDKLWQVQNFAKSDKCRRKILLAYFGETKLDNCGNCDICNPQEIIPKTLSPEPLVKSTKNKFMGNYSEEIFESLRKIRKDIADKEKMPAFVIFSDATLKHMAETCPRTNQEMLDVSGVGQHKLEKYGQVFLDFFLQSNTLPAINPINNYTVDKKVSAKKPPVGNTYAETLSLYLEGLTVEQIAAQRNLSNTTIYNHIELLYSTDKINNLDNFISTDEIERLRLQLQNLSVSPTLREIYESLGETLPYYKIKFILAYLNKHKTKST